MTKVEMAVAYAKQFVGLPYIWGGDDPIIGFDCSGLVQEILAAVGLDPSDDQTAQGLYDFYKTRSNFKEMIMPGTLVFYGKSKDHITHVAFMVECSLTVEAGGGGSSDVSPAAAARNNAYVRIRPYMHRSDVVALLTPNYV